MLGALASIAIDMKIPILCSQNQNITAKILLAIAKREQLKMKKSLSIRTKQKFKSMNQHQLFLLSGLPKINKTTAKKLLLYFRTPENIFKASEEELMQTEGVGKQLAKNIRRILTSEYEKSILED